MERRPGDEQFAVKKTEFDGGAVTISHFAPPEGFTFRTRQTIRRKPGFNPDLLTSEQQERLSQGMKGEPKFNDVQRVIDAREALKASLIERVQEGTLDLPEKNPEDYSTPNYNPNTDTGLYLSRFYEGIRDVPGFVDGLEDDVKQHYQTFEKERREYMQKGKKIKIRNLIVEGNTLLGDVGMTSYQAYEKLSHAEASAEVQDLSANAATAMIIRTADDRIIIQHRLARVQHLHEKGLSRGNATFGEMPGASAAGSLDASLRGEKRVAGEPDPIDTDFIFAGVLKEAEEELSLKDSDLSGVRIVGVAQDKKKPHDELLLVADSTLTAAQIREQADKTKKELGDADFEEKFVDIAGSPEAISTLVTTVHCPLPPTHAAALVAEGYAQVLKREDKAAAERWVKTIERGVQENYATIDAQVKSFYEKYPEALNQVPERFWGKNPPVRNNEGYDPNYLPQEQGLPYFEDAMIDAGLLSETRTFVPEVMMLDVDGPLSDPIEKQIKYDELVTELSDRLDDNGDDDADEPVVLNTGRSVEWIMERVTPRIRERVKEPSSLQKLVIIGEKGGTWVTFDNEGDAHHGKSAALSIPDAVNEAAKKLVQEKYDDCMFFDATKQTMMSIEMHQGYDLQLFKARQRELVGELNSLLAEAGLDETYKIDPTTIATDVESPYVGKALGADRCLQWLRDNNIKVGRFIAFGDSISDLEMADELQRKGKSVEFVYVGEADKLEEATIQGKVKDPHIIRNVGGYSKGTLEYLQSETTSASQQRGDTLRH